MSREQKILPGPAMLSSPRDASSASLLRGHGSKTLTVTAGGLTITAARAKNRTDQFLHNETESCFRPRLTSKNITPSLSQSPLFHGCDRQFLQDRLLQLEPVERPRGAVVLDAQQTTTTFFIVVEGRVKLVSRAEANEREITLFLLGPGEAFDVVSLLDQSSHNLTAEALDDVTLLSASAEQVRTWIAQHPEFNRTFLPYLGRKMSLLSELASDLTLHDTGIRLARLILRHVNPDSSKHDVQLINNLSHEELANMIGTVRVVANRQIQNLKRRGIIEASRGHLVVKDLDALIKQCDFTVPKPASKDGTLGA